MSAAQPSGRPPEPSPEPSPSRRALRRAPGHLSVLRSPGRARFVTACQQLLAFGVVLAVVTPAAAVVSLDIVGLAPDSAESRSTGLLVAGTTQPVAEEAEEAEEAADEPLLAAAEPVVEEHILTPPAGARAVPGGLAARSRVDAAGATELTSSPQPVTGYGTVGLTWAPGIELDHDEIAFAARTRTGGAWSDWIEVHHDHDHGPDPASPEGQRARPGTDELLVGEVDDVQVRATTRSGLPEDLRLAVVDPGETVEAPGATAADSATSTADSTTDSIDEPASARTSARSFSAPKPTIRTRAQWGADERLRDPGSLRYGTINAGFVHHTVNANDYSRSDVPAILRGIYAYHTQSRGWSDVGYNFLVDRFGRIWEGRYGGVDRPVVGAHTLGYNDYSFAMSAVGNFETVRPSEVMVKAYGKLFAWKLGLHDVDASSTRQKVGSSYFKAINGHRDAGSTACPGQYLYDRLSDIRRQAAERQQGADPDPEPREWTGRWQWSDLVASRFPDLVTRRSSDQQAVIIPTGGLSRFDAATRVPTGFGVGSTVLISPDLTGDGVDDALVQAPDGRARVRRGNGEGRFGTLMKRNGVFRGHDLLVAVGDLDRDGSNDVVGRRTADGSLDLFRGGGKGGFVRTRLADGFGGYDLLVATGDVTGDGLPDLMARDGGKLWLHAGTGGVGLADRTALRGSWSAFDTVTGFGDYTNDGRADLVVRRSGNQRVFVLPGRDDGRFGPKIGPFTQFAGVPGLTGGGNVLGDGAPDLVGRDGKRLVAFAKAPTYDAGAPVETGVSLRNAARVLNAGDFDKDGKGDLITLARSNGRIFLRSGNGAGGFGSAKRIGEGFGDVTQLQVVGDLTEDGWADLVGVVGGKTQLWPGAGRGTVGAARPWGSPAPRKAVEQQGLNLKKYDWVVEVSDLDGDDRPDLVVRERSSGRLFAVRRTGNGFASRWFLGDGMKAYDMVG